MDRLERKAFYKELMSLALPLGLQNLLTALIGATDALVLGRLSQDAVAAVSLANQFNFIMSLFMFSVVGGGGVLMAQYWGKGDRKTVKVVLCTAMKFTVGINLVFFLGAFLVPELLMRIYTPEPVLISIGGSYLRCVSFSYLFTGLTQCYYLIMKVSGKTVSSVTISVVSLVTDVVLDIILIYVIKMGPNGSAWSTVAVEAIALIWCVIFSRRNDLIQPDMEGFRSRSRVLSADMLKVSLPMLASSLAWGIGFSMHSLIMGHMGTDASAAASITSVVQDLVTCLCRGVSTGAGIMIGKLLGDNDLEKAKRTGREFWKVSIWVGVFNAVLILCVGPVVTAFFVLTETAKRYLTYMILFSAAYMFAYSLNTIITCGVFPAGGDAAYDAISVGYSMWCFALPLALVAAFLLKWPVMPVYIIMCADEIVKLPWILPRYRKYIWLKNLTREEI